MAENDYIRRWAHVTVALASDDAAERQRGIELIFARIEQVRIDVTNLRRDVRRWF